MLNEYYLYFCINIIIVSVFNVIFVIPDARHVTRQTVTPFVSIASKHAILVMMLNLFVMTGKFPILIVKLVIEDEF